MAVPQRFEDRVRESEVEDVLDGQLPEEVVDAVQLRLVDGRVKLVVERPGGDEVVPERLLDDDACLFRETRCGEPATTVPKSEGGISR
jgi:hypothetical protein